MISFNEKIKNKEYLKILFDNAPNIIFIHDILGNIYDTNNQTESITGYSKNELIGNNFFKLKLLPPHQALLATSRMAKLSISKKDRTYIYTLRKKSGFKINLEISTQSLKIDNKQYFLSIARDISERENNKNLFKEEETIIEQYINLVTVMIVGLNQKGNIILANKKACETLGYREHELLGMNWIDNFLPEEIRNEVQAVFDSTVNKGEKLTEFYENHIITKEGKELLVAWHNVALKDKNKKVYGVLSSGEDITEKRKKETLILDEKHNLEIFQKSAIDRELKMMELKEEIKRLKTLQK